MRNYIGTWRGVSTTIPNYAITEDLLRFNPDETIYYEAAAPNGRKWRTVYTTKPDGEDMIIFPEKGTEEVKREGYRIQITELDDSRISVKLGSNVTIYEREKGA